MPRINSLKIRKLGNVAPGTELRFDPRGVVLLGRNGTGKTTLLEILASLCKGDLGSISSDDYDIEFSMSCKGNTELNITAKCEEAPASPARHLGSRRGPDAALSARFQRVRRQNLSIEALETQSGQLTLIESNDRESRCTFSNGEVIVESIPADRVWVLLGFGAFTKHPDDPLEDAFYELVSLGEKLRRFDEGLDYFRSLTERIPGSACIGAIRHGQGYALDAAATRLVSHKCARLLLEDFKRNEENSTSGFGSSSQIEYLDLYCRLTGFQRARIGAELDEKRQTQHGAVVNFGPLRFSVERDGAILHHDHLSFGQRRLLAFLHYHDSTPDLIIADELVNGMHHEWIAECLRLMQNSQAFLSSQNPLLFDFLTFESAEEVANRFIICELDEQHRFKWRNMSEPDAVEFYDTYKTELQHVSEILRTRGYW